MCGKIKDDRINIFSWTIPLMIAWHRFYEWLDEYYTLAVIPTWIFKFILFCKRADWKMREREREGEQDQKKLQDLKRIHTYGYHCDTKH